MGRLLRLLRKRSGGAGAVWSPADLAELAWDSGDDPALGSAIPGSVSVAGATAEVWVVSRGHTSCAVMLGTNRMLFAGSMTADTAGDVYYFDGGLDTVPANYWPRFRETVHGWRGTGADKVTVNVNGRDYSELTVNAHATYTGGYVGCGIGGPGNFDFVGAVRRVLIFSTKLSPADRATLVAYLRTTYGVGAYTRQVVCAGDSLTVGYNSAGNSVFYGWTAGDHTYGWPYVVAQAESGWKVFNHGVTGKTISQMTGDDDTGVDPYLDATAFASNVCVVWAGTNDLVVDDVDLATLQSRVSAYCQSRQSAGWTVVYVEMMDRANFSAGQRTIRGQLNAWLPGRVGTDFAALASLPAGLSGASPWVGSPGLWDADEIHLSRTGYALVGASIRSAVAGV